jgi:hypothetical protein
MLPSFLSISYFDILYNYLTCFFFKFLSLISAATTASTTTIEGIELMFVSLVVSRFLFDQCLFLLQVLVHINIDIFPFQGHLQVNSVNTNLVSPLEQLIGK